MAGGKITRIVGGTNSIECDTWSVYTTNFTAYANEGSYFTADEGTIFGKPKEPPIGKYFVKGWWTDKEDKPIKEAKVLDIVRFHIQMKNIDNPNGKGVTISLYEYDGEIIIPLMRGVFKLSTDDHIRIMRGNSEVTTMTLNKDGKGFIELNLSWGLNNLFNEEVLGVNAENGDLELYFKCSYDEENVSLPDSFGDYLKVKRSDKNLFIQPACEGYNFPEIRTYNGDIVVFKEDIIEVDEKNETIKTLTDYLDEKKNEYLREKLEKQLDNRRRVIAVKQLQKGKLVTNTELVKFRKNIYTKSNFTNNGEEVIIRRASNMGWKKDGKLVTTKGISQIDYFENIGFKNGVLKASKELLNVFDFFDLANYMSGNGKPDFIPTGFAPLDLIIQLVATPVLQQFREMELNIINNILEQAKDGGIEEIKKFIQTRANVTNYNSPYTDQDDEKTYDVIDVNQNIYNKLMNGEIKTLRELRKLVLNEQTKENSNLNISILWKWQEDKTINNQIAVIETIFFPY